MWTCAGVLVLVACASAVTRDQFYPYGPGLDQNLPKGNDVPSLELPLRVPITFYGETHESVFINNFGVLTFRADISSFLAVEFPLPYASIAAFYSNIDTTSGGAVYFRETSEPHVLSKAEESVQNNFHDYYDFTPSSVFIATWVDVPYTANVTSNTPRNSFQVAVISNGNESFVELLYPERDIQWTQKEYQSTNLPDPKAQAGFISEDGRIYALRGSGSHQIKNIAFWSNTHEPGKYVFRVGEIPLEGNIATPDQYNQDEIEIEQESKTCAISGPILCHSDAKCIDYPAGICCQCKDGFYGNGKTCIRNNLPLRVHGKINGILNDIHLNDVDIQAYVVVGEGRAYTALTLLPPELGSSLQLLNVLGGVIGWLFANPLGSAKNGYQMTGSVFNHSADVWFPASGARVRINQEYLGHDAFDQISLETDVRGTLPVILTGTKLDVTDYEEQFTLIEPGIIRSDSSKTFTNRITGEQIEQRITQTISFSPCRFASPSVEDKTPATLKVIRNYLGYENRENIVRYGMTNKIFPLGQEDPCIKGRSTCGPHSACVAHENTYNCVCQSGFTSILQNNAVVCIDIDECQADTHNCDDNAECYNHAGGFQCRCRPGFTGNGVTCNPISTCYNKKCDSNAQCIEYPGQEAVCVCNFGFVGDGQLCYLDISHGDLPAANNEADYNDSIVLPNCNEYGCSCPPGYSDYRDTSGNQLCRLENYGAPPQELSTNTYQRPTEPSNYPPTESYYRQTEHPYQSSTESTSPPTTNYRPDQGNYQQNLYNPYNNYPQNNYDQNSGDNIPYGISQPSEYNNQEPTENNYPPSGYNYEQGPDNNNQPPSENNYHHQWGNNYPPSDNYGQQEGNYYQTSDRNSETPPPTSYSQSNQQTSSENEYQQSTVTEDNLQSCEEDAECPPNAVCSNKHCVCPEGYEGDGFECIERTGSYCSCGSNARCVNTGSNEYYCVCDLGYQGDGYICQPNNYGCRNNSDCELNAECRPDSHSNEYICQCVQGYVKDHNDACILDAQLCNGALCASHASCLSDREMGLDYCHCDEGYTGDGISQCVVAEQTCEVTNNCSPYAVCTPVDNSYQCICAEGYTGDGYSCTQDVTCRYDPNICDLHASCLKRNDAYACECNAGYNGDGHSCELNARPAGNFLVTSDGASVYKVPFRITPTHYAIPFNSDISQIAVGIDVDCESGTIFWGDVVSYSIKSSRYDGSGYEAFLVDGVYTPEGIAVDWLSRNIFWTDSKKLTIEVANMDTKARKVLFAIKDISNPRGIAVHPQRGKIFWSDWKRTDPKIEWASMDGTQRGIFLDKSDVTLPNSLAIDWIRDRLCYADPGLSSIKCVSIDSREKETVAANCSFPFGLAIHGNKFYWSDWRTMNIEFVDVETKERGSMSIVSHGSKRLYDIAVAPDQCPQMYSICMQRNGGCGVNQLCLPDGNNGRSCVDADATFSRRRR